MKYLLYGSSDYSNLGCEAIVQGARLILSDISNVDIGIATQLPLVDGEILKNMDVSVEKISRGREGIANIVTELLLRVGCKHAALLIPHRNAQKLARKYDYSCSMGGDNYCYSGRERFYRINKGMRKYGRGNIFWGCSIEPSDINAQMKKDLNGYKWIFARESLTADALRKNGFDNVVLCSDPAFVMPAQEIEIPTAVSEGKRKYIGINLSPLIFDYSKNDEKVKAAIVSAMREILEKTPYGLCFIPHVYNAEADIYVNKMFAELLGRNDRVICFEKKVTAPQIKYLIQCMSGMICARTHASIAAYSSGVPTFVLGYSIKSMGIAKDIYGTYEGHVMPVQTINEIDEFTRRILSFVETIPEEKIYLEEKMPQYIANAYIVKKYLN